MSCNNAADQRKAQSTERCGSRDKPTLTDASATAKQCFAHFAPWLLLVRIAMAFWRASISSEFQTSYVYQDWTGSKNGVDHQEGIFLDQLTALDTRKIITWSLSLFQA
jgi:hypothetical protein